MTDINRRTATLLALLAPFAAGSALAETSDHHIPDMGPEMNKVPWVGNEQIAMLIYPGMTVMDLIGPHCMFGGLMGRKSIWLRNRLTP